MTQADTPSYAESGLRCLVCKESLEVRLAKGRKSAKTFLMLVCPVDGRHFRGFINDQDYVKGVLERLEGKG